MWAMYFPRRGQSMKTLVKNQWMVDRAVVERGVSRDKSGTIK